MCRRTELVRPTRSLVKNCVSLLVGVHDVVIGGTDRTLLSAFCALIHKHFPGKVLFPLLRRKEREKNLELAFSRAEEAGPSAPLSSLLHVLSPPRQHSACSLLGIPPHTDNMIRSFLLSFSLSLALSLSVCLSCLHHPVLRFVAVVAVVCCSSPVHATYGVASTSLGFHEC